MGRRILLTYHHQTFVILFEIFVTQKILLFLSESFCHTSLGCSETVLWDEQKRVCVRVLISDPI